MHSYNINIEQKYGLIIKLLNTILIVKLFKNIMNYNFHSYYMMSLLLLLVEYCNNNYIEINS